MLELSFRQTAAEEMVRIASTLVFRAFQTDRSSCIRLSDVAEAAQYGFTASATVEPIGPKLVRITDLKDGRINWATVPYCLCPEPKNYLLKQGDILFARTGATTGKTYLVEEDVDAVFASYLIRLRPRSDVLPEFMYAFFQSDAYWSQIIEGKEGSAQPNVNGRKLMNIIIPRADIADQRQIVAFLRAVRSRQDGEYAELPQLPSSIQHQGRIVERVENVVARLRRINGLQSDIEAHINEALLGAFHRCIDGANRKPMSEVAPLVRRPVTIEASAQYAELGVRSFGKGTFHKPQLDASLVGTKKLFRIEEGDLLFNIVFAWEGAVAVALQQDHNRVGSHRFLTCVADPHTALPDFLKFHFLTDEGLEQLGQASPGGAGRNRTLGIDKLARIEVPVPLLQKQQHFVRLLQRLDERQGLRKGRNAEMAALRTSFLNRAINGRF